MCNYTPAFFMPLYEYQSEESEDPERSCRVCRHPFELRRNLSRASLLQCPLCKNSLKRLPSVTSIGNSLSDSDVKSTGFTVLKNLGGGVLEKL